MAQASVESHQKAKTDLATRLQLRLHASGKTADINYANFWSCMAQKYDPEEEEAAPGLSSTLTASDIAMLPDGANSSIALKLAEFKKKLNKIKGSNAPSLRAGLAASNLLSREFGQFLVDF